MPITESGRELWANALGALNKGYYGTAESLSGTHHVKVKFSGTPFTASAFIGHDAYIEGKVGTILSNTSSEFEVARWEEVGKRETEAAEPSGTPKVLIAGGQTPALWMGLSTSTTETEKISEWEHEYYKAGGGLIRQVAEFAETSHTKPGKFTVKAKFTFNGSDAELKVGSIGILNCANTAANEKGPTGQRLLFWTKLSSVATLSTSGDSVEITDTVEGS